MLSGVGHINKGSAPFQIVVVSLLLEIQIMRSMKVQETKGGEMSYSSPCHSCMPCLKFPIARYCMWGVGVGAIF